MQKEELRLKKADRVEITTLADNYVDVFLSDTDKAKRSPLITEGNVTRGLLADHGLSFLLDVFEASNHHQILFDTGQVDAVVPFNIETLGICLENVEAVVIGHGHLDHFGGLLRLYRERIVPRNVSLVVHPDVFSQRSVAFPDGRAARMPQLTRPPLNHLGVRIQETKSPLLLASGLALLTGEIERVTGFEHGFPPGRKFEEGQIKLDTMIWDEQAIVFNVKNRGLVVVSSCGHPGIINTILYAQKLTNETKVYAVIGGFHLTGSLFEPLIERTVAEMKKLAPDVVVPCHCTGWKAINQFAKEMPKEFALNSVGTKYIL